MDGARVVSAKQPRHARNVSDPLRVLEQGPDRQRTPDGCSGGVSSMRWSLPGVDGVTIGRLAAQGKSWSANETALQQGQWGFMKGASRCCDHQHQQQQPVALRIQQPGFCAKGFLEWRFVQRGAQAQRCADPGVEHGNGARRSSCCCWGRLRDGA